MSITNCTYIISRLKDYFTHLLRLLLIVQLVAICLLSFGSKVPTNSVEDSLKSIANKHLQNKDGDNYYNALIAIMRHFEYQGNWGKHDSVVQEMIDYGSKYQLPDFLTEAYNQRAIANSYQGNNPEAVRWFRKSLEIFRSNNDSAALANMLGNIAIVYTDMGLYKEALDYELQSLRIREKLSHPKIFNNYSEISIIYRRLDDAENQLKYLNKAKDYLKGSGSTNYNNWAILHNMLGKYFKDQSLYDSALYHYGKVHEFSQIIGWKRGMAVGLGNMAEIHYAIGDFAKALDENIKVLEISQSIDDASGVTEQLYLVSKSYLAHGNHSQAQNYAYLALKKAQEHGFVLEERNALMLLSNIFQQRGQFQKSLTYYKQFHTISDSLTNIDKVNHLAELEKKFETEKKEHQITMLSTENDIKNQRIKLGIIAILLLVVVLVLGALLYVQRQRTAKAMEADLQQKLSRSQMNPHFVSNAMSSIQSFMYNNNPTEAAKYLGKFAQLNRAVLEHSLVDSISLEEEVEMLTSYLEFEQLRLKKSFTFSFEIDKDTDTELINIPPLFIQPFVENAVKHGIKDLDKGGKITIRLTDCNKYLKVEVIDNGKGITTEDTAVNSKHKSRSIEIVSKRLKLLRNKYKDLPNFTIINIDNGVCVTQFLPILPC